MGFDEDFAIGGFDMIQEIGEMGVFVPDEGLPVDLLLYLDYEEQGQAFGVDMPSPEKVETMQYLLDDVGRVAQTGETFILGGVYFTVDTVIEVGNKDGIVKVAVRR